MLFTTLAAVLLVPFLVTAAPLRKREASANDKTVLKFAELLEQLETEFYKEALQKFTKPDDFKAAGINVPEVAIQNFQAIGSHELAHTQFLDAALDAVGEKPISGCKFVFDSALTDVATMATVARVVEAVGVGAYLGGSTIVDSKDILVAAASILTIEARHQTFLNVLNGASGIPQPFDIALTPPQVLSLAAGFIQGCDVQGALGITANPPLAIANNGTVAPGTLLTFKSPALTADANNTDLSCQMLIGGGNANGTAVSLPLAQCIVPSGINGPVAIFLTNSSQPLAADVVKQDASSILAGPAIAFIDVQVANKPDALGALVRNTTNPVQSSDQITPAQASDALNQATGSVTPATNSSTAATSTGTDSSSPPSSSSSPSGTPAQDNSPSPSPSPSSSAPGAVQVIGVTTIPA